MASPTRITDRRRARKKTKMGQARKRVARNKGTTPRFAIHPDK